MGNFEIIKNTQKEVFLQLSLVAKMVLQRSANLESSEESQFREIIEALLQMPDISLIRDQHLFYLVAISN